jgi:7-carboxy-7-deazaguanine synthase
MLPVNEIFYTIQGEAEFTGQPALFVRLQFCPVGCQWCDTKYTWELEEDDKVDLSDILSKTAEDENSEWSNISAEQLEDIAKGHNAFHIVFTGGEPCFHDLSSVTKYLCDKGYSVQVETSGTHDIRVDDRVWVTVSPKVGMLGGFSVKPEALERANEIKHPVVRQRDLDNLQELFETVDIPLEKKIWLQPVSEHPKAIAICKEACLKYGYNLSMQVHKYANAR